MNRLIGLLSLLLAFFFQYLGSCKYLYPQCNHVARILFLRQLSFNLNLVILIPG